MNFRFHVDCGSELHMLRLPSLNIGDKCAVFGFASASRWSPYNHLERYTEAIFKGYALEYGFCAGILLARFEYDGAEYKIEMPYCLPVDAGLFILQNALVGKELYITDLMKKFCRNTYYMDIKMLNMFTRLECNVDMVTIPLIGDGYSNMLVLNTEIEESAR